MTACLSSKIQNLGDFSQLSIRDQQEEFLNQKVQPTIDSNLNQNQIQFLSQSSSFKRSNNFEQYTEAESQMSQYDIQTPKENKDYEEVFNEQQKEVSQNVSSKQPILQESKGFKGTQENAKTKMCLRWLQGQCRFGDRCNFAHGDHELRKTTNKQAQESEQDLQYIQPNIQWFYVPNYQQMQPQPQYQLPPGFQQAFQQQLQMRPPYNQGMQYNMIPGSQGVPFDAGSLQRSIFSQDRLSQHDSRSASDKMEQSPGFVPQQRMNMVNQALPQYVMPQSQPGWNVQQPQLAFRPVSQVPYNLMSGQNMQPNYQFNPQAMPQAMMYPGGPYQGQYVMSMPMTSQSPLQGMDNMGYLQQQQNMLFRSKSEVPQTYMNPNFKTLQRGMGQHANSEVGQLRARQKSKTGSKSKRQSCDSGVQKSPTEEI